MAGLRGLSRVPAGTDPRVRRNAAKLALALETALDGLEFGPDGTLIVDLSAKSIGDLGDVSLGGISFGNILQWNGTGFVPVDGTTGGTTSILWNVTPSGTIDGSNDTFTLPAAVRANTSILLTLNGLALSIGDDYSVTADTITMTVIPESGDRLRAVFEPAEAPSFFSLDFSDQFNSMYLGAI